ncbi:MAG: MgtC/SapB family protein [Acidobacteriota bacterium]|nr:MgtC/SapB family protein [Acidobacteriota bacterium]
MEWTTLRDFAIALLIGALVGTERENRKRKEDRESTSGLRTFILLAMVGAVSAWLGSRMGTPWLFIAALLLVTGSQIASYVMTSRVQPEALGLTTEAGALCVCLLGGMTMLGYPELAVGLGIVATAVLAYKEPMHGLVSKLGRDDIYAGLRLLIASFIILPLIPNRTVDPWNALNPYNLWLLVILISALSLAGYIATRWLGPGRGTALTGLTGGLVSSTAVTLSFARGGRDSVEPDAGDTFATGIMVAWGVMSLRVLVEAAVVYLPMVSRLAIPFVAMSLTGFFAAGFFYRRSARMQKGAEKASRDVPLKNPFSLTKAATFGLIFAVILLAVKIVEERFSSQGLYLVSILAGLTDVDAITLSLAKFAKSGGNQTTAVYAITMAALANTCAKCGLVVALSSRSLKRRVFPATLAIALMCVIALLFV